MPALIKKQIPEWVVTLLQTLTAEQLGEVILFMEFLKSKETLSPPEDPLWLSITREADARVMLEQVRTRLRTIPSVGCDYSGNGGTCVNTYKKTRLLIAVARFISLEFVCLVPLVIQWKHTS